LHAVNLLCLLCADSKYGDEEEGEAEDEEEDEQTGRLHASKAQRTAVLERSLEAG
jgi:hypothetical protein